MKPTIPEIIQLLREFGRKPKNSVGGNLHIVLEDGNVNDSDVQFCLDAAKADCDAEAVALAEIILKMSKTQRKKLAGMFHDIIK